MGPLSGKERREDYAVSAKQVRENVAHTLEQRRKQELHALKLRGEAAKYGVAPPSSAAGPLAAPQPAPQSGSTDTVPAMLTPGEAVIPAEAAQNPANKGIIQGLVNQGRFAKSPLEGLTQHFLGGARETIRSTAPDLLRGGRNRTIDDAERTALGLAEGTTSVPFPLARRR